MATYLILAKEETYEGLHGIGDIFLGDFESEEEACYYAREMEIQLICDYGLEESYVDMYGDEWADEFASVSEVYEVNADEDMAPEILDAAWNKDYEFLNGYCKMV